MEPLGLEAIIRLMVAMVVGGLVGLERELHDRPAGLRTHILVCLGAALIMIISVRVSLSMVGITESDPARIAAQVVSGIGFLGAGTILREGVTVRGLTTAASLWIAAALGLGAGAGLYAETAFATVLTLVSLSVLSRLDVHTALKRNVRQIRVVAADRPGLLGEVGEILGSQNANIVNIRLTPRDGSSVEIVVYAEFSAGTERLSLLEKLESISGVTQVEIAGRDVRGSL